MKDLNSTFFSWFLQGMRASVLMCLPLILFSFVFGLAAFFKKLTCFQTVMMSMSMFAGPAQFAVLKSWNIENLPFLELILTSVLVCFFFVLMSMRLRPIFIGVKPWQVYLSLFFLIEINWALTLIEANKSKLNSSKYLWAYYFGSGLTLYLGWVIGTYVGYISGRYIHDISSYGLDFVFTAFMIVLLIRLWRGKDDIFPVIAALLASLLAAKYIPGNWYILIGTLTGSFLGALKQYKTNKFMTLENNL